MINTRTLVVYISVLVFFVSAIGYTVAKDMQFGGTHVSYVGALATSTQTASALTATAVQTAPSETDRAATIARLREKLAGGGGVIEGEPVVLTSVDAPTFEPQQPGAFEGVRTVVWCDVPRRTEDIVQSWRADRTSIEDAEGARVVYQQTGPDTKEPRLQLPVPFPPSAESACLPHEIVGVSTTGALIQNTDVSRYDAAGATTHIGYALDGYPIYGADPAAELDSCGGQMTDTGYQYHLRADEPFVLACFAGTPTQFIRE